MGRPPGEPGQHPRGLRRHRAQRPADGGPAGAPDRPHPIPRSKKIAELLGEQLAEATGTQIVSLRISGSWGPLGHQDPFFAAPALIIWTLKNQLGLERHSGRIPAGLWARIIQRLLALNACIWHNWLIGAPVKRSLIAYDHI
jgi:hypothetical protein